MTPLQRRAAIKANTTLCRLTLGQVAKEMGVSYNHLTLVLRGDY